MLYSFISQLNRQYYSCATINFPVSFIRNLLPVDIFHIMGTANQLNCTVQE